jgi:uncharacterized protein RhaS with RHS repeats
VLSHTEDGETTTYGYDAVGKIAKVDCANLADTLFTYDGAGRRIAMRDGSGLTWL